MIFSNYQKIIKTVNTVSLVGIRRKLDVILDVIKT